MEVEPSTWYSSRVTLPSHDLAHWRLTSQPCLCSNHHSTWAQMMHKAWSSIEEAPYCFSGSSVKFQDHTGQNKANLRDLIAATGLVFLLKLDLNPRFFSPCDLKIWWMTPKNNRAPLLCCFKLFASFRSHWWMQTGVTVRKPLIWVKIDAFLSRVTIGHLFYATSSFGQHFVAIGEFKLELEFGKAQSGSNAALFRAVWPWNLTDDLEKQ